MRSVPARRSGTGRRRSPGGAVVPPPSSQLCLLCSMIRLPLILHEPVEPMRQTGELDDGRQSARGDHDRARVSDYAGKVACRTCWSLTTVEGSPPCPSAPTAITMSIPASVSAHTAWSGVVDYSNGCYSGDIGVSIQDPMSSTELFI